MNVTVSREQGYWRAKCTDKDTCASYTSAGNVGAYWRGPHRSNQRDAHADAIAHLSERHGVPAVCDSVNVVLGTYCGQPAVGVVNRRGAIHLRCADHHVDLRRTAS